MFYDNYVRLCNSIQKSPSAVALEIGIAKPTVSRWKSGSKPNHATMLKVADYFGVSVSLLLEENDDAAFSSVPQSIPFSRAGIKSLSPEALKFLSEWITDEMNGRLSGSK